MLSIVGGTCGDIVCFSPSARHAGAGCMRGRVMCVKTRNLLGGRKVVL